MTKGRYIPKAVRDKLLVDAMHRCCLCPEHHNIFDLHHIDPISEGGPNTEDNLMVTCPTCHAKIHRIRDLYSPVQLRMYKERWVALCQKGLPLDVRLAELAPGVSVEGDADGYVPPKPPDSDELPEPGALPPGSRPFHHRNALFTGREEDLKMLARSLLHNNNSRTLVTQCVQGMGGIGKTQLAVEFSYRYGRFFHGVHWVNAAQPEAIDGEVAACGLAMDLGDWPEELPQQVERTLWAWHGGSSRLVILDNLEDVGAARGWLARLSGGAVRVLLTARYSDWPRDLGLNALPLELFTEDESRAFLRKYLKKGRATDGELNSLGDRLGHLPLALELAGRYLARRRMSVDDYVGRLERVLDDAAMRAWKPKSGSPTKHDLDLAQTFSVSWEAVTDEAARRAFLVAGFCAPNEPIPCELVEGGADLERESCDEALGVLVDLGLLEWEGQAEGPTIHPLLAEYAQGLEEADEALIGLAGALAKLAAAANAKMDETGSPEWFNPLLAHVRAVAPAAEAARWDKAGRLHNELGYHLHRVADYSGAREAFERALAIDEAVYGPDHPEVATDVNNLGGVLQALGELQGAREAFERALAIDEAVYGPDHPSVARDVNNLGSVLQALGELQGAREAFERALAIDEAVYGPDHPNVAIRVNNLGGVLKDLGELQGAREAFERALAIDEAVYGPDHPSVARDVNNLGSVLQDLGELQGAREAFERALAIDEAVYGPDHPEVATDVNNLGLVLQALGELQGAREAFERALAILKAFLPAEHPYIRAAEGNLDQVEREIGDT